MSNDIRIDEARAHEALHTFILAMDMVFAYDMTSKYSLVKDSSDYFGPIVAKDGKLYDDRGSLFAAIRNLLNVMYPNLEFRSDDYIIDWNKIAKEGDISDES